MDAPFFIVGNDRSGTTMLRLILDAGPDAAIPPESMFLTDFPAADWLPRLPDAADELLQRVWSHPKVRLWALPGDPPPLPRGLDALGAYRWVMERPFLAYAAKEGKSRWGDKTPHYVHHVDALLGVWPEARFVVLVRDGRDVALSLRRMPFGPNNAWAAAQWWARGIRAGQSAAAAHPDAVTTVRYEDLVTRPEAVVPEVSSFLGLRFEPRMLDLAHADRDKIVRDQRGWFPGMFGGIDADRAGRWQREMPERDRRLFARLAGDELAALRYPVGEPGGPPSPRREAWYRRHNELMRNVNFVRLRVVTERGRELRYALERRWRDPLKRA